MAGVALRGLSLWATAAVFAVVATMSLSSCSVPRTAVRVPPPVTISVSDEGPRYIITRVVDARTFAPRAEHSSEPSISPELIDHADTRARIFGRDMGDYRSERTSTTSDSVVSGDPVLFETREALSRLIGDTVQAGFAGAGLVSYGQDDLALPGALPVEISILEFWAWYSGEDAFVQRMYARAVIEIVAPIAPFESGKQVLTRRLLRTTITNPGPRQWRNAAHAAAEGLADEVTELLVAASSVGGVP